MTKTWFALRVQVPAGDAEALCDLFLGWGALSASLEGDPGEGDARWLDDPSSPRQGLPERCRVTALLEGRDSVRLLLARAGEVFSWAREPVYSVKPVEDQDWVRLTQASWEPFPVGGRLWIVPTWASPPDPEALYVRLDPGLAFGTGRHATTRLCLEILAEFVRGGESVLDYGCGSGILAIAALKLGAREAVGVDTDRQALETSAVNARHNAVRLSLYLPEGAPEMQADLVMANILSTPLKILAPKLAGYARPGGMLVLSGILEEQVEEVKAAYRRWVAFEDPRTDGSWACLAGRRKFSLE